MTCRPGRFLNVLLFRLSSTRGLYRRPKKKNSEINFARHMETNCQPRPVYHPTLKMRPRRYVRYSGDDRHHGQAERVSAAGSPSLRDWSWLGKPTVSSHSHRAGSGLGAWHGTRHSAHGIHEAWMPSEPRKSPVYSVIQSHNRPLLVPVRFACPAMTSYQAFLTKVSPHVPNPIQPPSFYRPDTDTI